MSGPENRPGQAIRIACPGGEIGPDTCSPGGDLLLWRIQLPAAQDKQSADCFNVLEDSLLFPAGASFATVQLVNAFHVQLIFFYSHFFGSLAHMMYTLILVEQVELVGAQCALLLVFDFKRIPLCSTSQSPSATSVTPGSNVVEQKGASLGACAARALLVCRACALCVCVFLRCCEAPHSARCLLMQEAAETPL